MNYAKANRLFAVDAKYSDKWEEFFSLISEKQMKDEILWQLLVRQYVCKTDDVDEGWRGEYWGKLMRGGVLIYSHTKDEELYKVLTDAVLKILATQEENGRISAYSQKREFIGWDMWSRKYIMLGLEYFYDICSDVDLKNKIVKALIRHADYIIERVGYGEGQIRIRETSNFHLGYNAFSILQPIVKLYGLTKEDRYLSYAKQMVDAEFEEGGLFYYAKETDKYPFEYPVQKVYEMTSCFEGLLEYYQIVGNDEYLKTAMSYADKILEKDFAIIGASGGHDEYFDNSTKTQVIKTDINKFETCVTVTLMRFFAAIYKLTGEKRYIDAIERSFYNAYIGALTDSENLKGFAIPLFYSYSPVFQNERWVLMGGGKDLSSYAKFGCCIAIGAAGLGTVPTVGVCEDEDGITVALYIEGEYKLSDSKLVIQTDYPHDGRVKLMLSSATNSKKLKLRVPDWCEKCSINGVFVENEGFAEVEIMPNESVVFEMEMPYKLHSSKDVNSEVEETFAITRGPIVLCADSCEADLYKQYDLETVDGCAVGKYDGEKYSIALKSGKTLVMREYSKAGKCYYAPREISVWINCKKD
ncbi:MAG: glycoside hydrolase family 127 protein [Clostridia bacterium]|nr:glycoside hydrolase family 127 protein [Clostridia bacterium]